MSVKNRDYFHTSLHMTPLLGLPSSENCHIVWCGITKMATRW